MVFVFQIVFIILKIKKNINLFTKEKLPSGFILNNLLKFYFVKLGTIIIKRRIISSYKI